MVISKKTPYIKLGSWTNLAEGQSLLIPHLTAKQLLQLLLSYSNIYISFKLVLFI